MQVLYIFTLVICVLIVFCSARHHGIREASRDKRLVPHSGGNLETGQATWRMTSIANRLFAHHLYKYLAANRRGNILISPFVVSTGLSMTLLGARGQTEKELMDALGYSALGQKRNGKKYTTEDVPRLYQSMLENVKKSSNKGAHMITIASRLFGDYSQTFSQDFVNGTEKYFNARLEKVDFANHPEESRIHINEWVSNKTRNTIKEALPSGTITAATLLTLVSTAYFKAEWQHRFDPDQTVLGTFTNQGGEEMQTYFMRGEFRLRYAFWKMAGAHVLILPYKNTDSELENEYAVEMELYLPVENVYPALIDKMNENDFFRKLKRTQMYTVDITLPKFRMDFEIDLAETLQNLNVKTLFGAADLSGMNGKTNLNLGAAFHKTFIEVNEEGTEAGSSFSQTMNKQADHLALTFDHTFVIIIREKHTNTILFMGRVDSPSNNE